MKPSQAIADLTHKSRRDLICAWALRRISTGWSEAYAVTICLVHDEELASNDVGFRLWPAWGRPIGLHGLLNHLQSRGYIEFTRERVRKLPVGVAFLNSIQSNDEMRPLLDALPMSGHGILDTLAID